MAELRRGRQSTRRRPSERLWNTLILGVARARQGALAEGNALKQRVLDVFHGIESFVRVPFFQAHLADALPASGDIARAQGAAAAERGTPALLRFTSAR
jgi:hypothetical protein